MKRLGNLIDNAISIISPETAVRRAQARSAFDFSASFGNYNSTKSGNSTFEDFFAPKSDANSVIDHGKLDTLRNQSREFVRNVDVATAIIDRICDHAVGEKGLSLHPKIDADALGITPVDAQEWQHKTAKLWRSFAESKDSDIEQSLNFGERTQLTLRSQLEGGDCFTLLLNQAPESSPFSLRFQTLEAERVSNPNYQANSSKMAFGVEKDKYGAPIKYHFRQTHPGSSYIDVDQTWYSVPTFDRAQRRRVIHHFKKLRPGQTRGIPLLAPAMEKILNLGELGRAELLASVLNSFYTVIVKDTPVNRGLVKTAPTQSTTQSSANKIAMGSGTIVKMDASSNASFESFDPKRPNQAYKPFADAILGFIGASVGLPKSVILMWFEQSYSAARGEVLEANNTYLKWRTHVAANICQPAYSAFLDEAVARGYVEAPGYFDSPLVRQAYLGSPYEQWIGPVMPAIDPLKEAQANAVMINTSKTKSRKQVASESGRDWDESIFPELLEEDKLLRQLMDAEIAAPQDEVSE